MSVRLVTLLWELRAFIVELSKSLPDNSPTIDKLNQLVARIDAELRDR